MGKSKKELLSQALKGSPASIMMGKPKIDDSTEDIQEAAFEQNQSQNIDIKTEEPSTIDQESAQIAIEQTESNETQSSSDNLFVPPSVEQSREEESVSTHEEPSHSNLYNSSVVSNTMQPLTRNYIKTNPTKSKKVCYLITPHIHQNLERIAKESGSSVNQLVNDILNYFIDHYDQ